MTVSHPKSPHVIFICSRWHPNVAGPAAYVRRTLKPLLIAFDDEISIVTEVRRHHMPPEPPELPKGFFATVQPISWLPFGLGSELTGAWLAMKAWAFGLRRSRRPILYFTGGHVSAGWRTAAILGKWLRVRVIVESVLVGADDAASLLQARWRLLTRTAARRVACFSTISSALKTSFASDLPEVTVVYNPYGVDTELFQPASIAERSRQRLALGLSDHDFVGLFVGNVNPRKDVLSLVEAWIETALSRPDTHWTLLVVGHYDPNCDYARLVQKRLEDVPNNLRICLLGVRDDIPAIMSACDAYVSASTAEGLGLANVEALASGLPVVCRYLSGITDDMTHGDAVTGIRDWSPPAFARAMSRVADPRQWNRCSADARTVAVERFALTERIERLLALSQR
jgi:glycosyltransferase involved in cell wall biosynthesis